MNTVQVHAYHTHLSIDSECMYVMFIELTDSTFVFCHYYSDADCTRGFPNFPVFELGSRTSEDHITTLLIPKLNFTCNVSIIGFAVAGKGLDREPYSQFQVWRQNSSQNSAIYSKTGNSTPVNVPSSGGSSSGVVCLASQRIIQDVFWCILLENFQVSVRPGDILGLELPQTDDAEIWFTSEGPVNYMFENRLGSSVNLSHAESNPQQLPQILFNLTSGYIILCMCSLINFVVYI